MPGSSSHDEAFTTITTNYGTIERNVGFNDNAQYLILYLIRYNGFTKCVGIGYVREKIVFSSNISSPVKQTA